MTGNITELLGPPSVLGEGLGLLEGPAWRDGDLFFVAVSRGLVWRLRAGVFDEYARTGGGPNGLAFDASGTLWVAQNGGQRSKRQPGDVTVPGIQRIDGSATTVVLDRGYDAPNDIAIGPDGWVYFTDPPVDPEHHAPLPGRLCRFDPATGAEEVLDVGKLFPNGLAFHPYGPDLYVVETGKRRILRYAPAGVPEVYAQLDHGEPDGMCFDAEGRLYVANGPGNDLALIEPGGEQIRYVPVLEGGGKAFPTNCCFGGPDLKTLFVTLASGGRLVAFDAAVAGAPLPPATRS